MGAGKRKLESGEGEYLFSVDQPFESFFKDLHRLFDILLIAAVGGGGGGGGGGEGTGRWYGIVLW
jgi:hypothetical protein